MAIRDLARTNVVTCTRNDTVADVVRKLHQSDVSGLVVVEDDQPQGLVTHRDVSKLLLEPDVDADDTSIGEFLTGETTTVDADLGVYDLLDFFSDEGIRRAPVVESDGTLVGIISISDIVVLLGMELQHVANAIRSSSPAYERSGPDFYEHG